MLVTNTIINGNGVSNVSILFLQVDRTTASKSTFTDQNKVSVTCTFFQTNPKRTQKERVFRKNGDDKIKGKKPRCS